MPKAHHASTLQTGCIDRHAGQWKEVLVVPPTFGMITLMETVTATNKSVTGIQRCILQASNQLILCTVANVRSVVSLLKISGVSTR